jgi:ELWxxDGT repeat protein
MVNPGVQAPPLGTLTVMGSTLYYRASTLSAGAELWKSDGTAAGTGMVWDLWPGAAHSSPTNLLGVGGTLYFSADNGFTGVELWKWQE